MFRHFFVFLFSLAALSAQATGLALRIVAQPRSSVFGEPVHITVQIISEGQFSLPRPFGRCDGHIAWSATDERGNRATSSSDEIPCPKVLGSPLESKAVTKYDCLATTSWNILLLPGRYHVQAEYHSHGPYLDRYSETDQRPVPGIWEGDLTSNVAEVEVLTPKGEDLRALKALGLTSIDKAALTSIAPFLNEHAGDFLSRFPTSTYAAYVVWEMSDAKGIAQSEPSMAVRALETGLVLRSDMSLWCPGASAKLTPGVRNGKEAIDCRAYWYAIVLKNHPDIWFADQIRLRSAIDQLALKNNQAAQADLEAIAKSEISDMAPRAKQYLDLMKQKGWIKE